VATDTATADPGDRVGGDEPASARREPKGCMHRRDPAIWMAVLSGWFKGEQRPVTGYTLEVSLADVGELNAGTNHQRWRLQDLPRGTVQSGDP
jgi:hypothetical protein